MRLCMSARVRAHGIPAPCQLRLARLLLRASIGRVGGIPPDARRLTLIRLRSADQAGFRMFAVILDAKPLTRMAGSPGAAVVQSSVRVIVRSIHTDLRAQASGHRSPGTCPTPNSKGPRRDRRRPTEPGASKSTGCHAPVGPGPDSSAFQISHLRRGTSRYYLQSWWGLDPFSLAPAPASYK